jgi:hypothetical protein
MKTVRGITAATNFSKDLSKKNRKRNTSQARFGAGCGVGSVWTFFFPNLTPLK